MLKEWFETRDNRIITNSDLDGVFSAMLLQKFFGTKVAGITNSADVIIAETWGDFVNAAYVDMFMADPKVSCIDQHIIAYDRYECEALKKNPNKLNPNLARFRSFKEDYQRKFPLSTFHYLLILLKKDGFDYINDSEWFKKLSLRIDDVLSNTVKYKDNIEDWMRFTGDAPSFLSKSLEWAYSNADAVPAIKAEVESFLKTSFNCETRDGGFKNILVDGKMNPDLRRLFRYVAELFNVDVDYLDDVTYKSIKRETMRCKSNANINKENLLSYAYINSPYTSKQYNFSCTISKPQNKVNAETETTQKD